MTERWLDTATRPDLYPPPVQKKSANPAPVSSAHPPAPAASEDDELGFAAIMGLPVQSKADGGGPSASATPLEASVGSDAVSSVMSRSSGRNLDNSVAREMSGGVGVDTSGVEVHTDAAADAATRMTGARAMTSGHHIYFRGGEYAPESTGGKHLLAHELTHVKQQSEGRTAGLARKASDSDDAGARDALEQEADATADKVVVGEASGEIDWSKVNQEQLSQAAREQGIKLSVPKEQGSGSVPSAVHALIAKLFPDAVQQKPAGESGKGVQLDRLKDWNEKPWGGEYSNVKVSPIPDLIGEKADYATKISRWASAMEGYSHFDSCIYEYIARKNPWSKVAEWSGSWAGNTTGINAARLAKAHWGDGATYRHALGAASSWFADIEAYADFKVMPIVETAAFVKSEELPDYSKKIPIQSSGNTAIEFSASTSDTLQQGYSVTNTKGQSNYLASELTSSIGADLGVVSAKIESSVEAKKTIEKSISANKTFSSQVTKGSGFTIKIPATQKPVNKVAIPNYKVTTLLLHLRKSDSRGVASGGSYSKYVHYIRPTGKYELSDAAGAADVKPLDYPTTSAKQSHDAQEANEDAEFRPVSPGSMVHTIRRIGSMDAVRNYADQVRATADGLDESGKTIELEASESHAVTVDNGSTYSTSAAVTNEINASIKSEIGLGEAASKATGITASVGGKISSGQAIKRSVDESISESTSRSMTISDKRTAQVPPFKKTSLYLTPLAKVSSYEVMLINGKTLYVHSYVHQPVRHSHVHITAKRQPHPERWKEA